MNIYVCGLVDVSKYLSQCSYLWVQSEMGENI